MGLPTTLKPLNFKIERKTTEAVRFSGFTYYQKENYSNSIITIAYLFLRRG